MINIYNYVKIDDVLKTAEKYNVRNIMDHEIKVEGFAGQIYDVLDKDFYLTRDCRDLLSCSAILHDVGCFINKSRHQWHTKYIILQEENFQIKKLFGEVAELYEPSIYLKKLKFYLHYARDLPEEIYASKEGLQAMLMNLLSNALKFTEQGSIKLSVSAEQNSDGAAYLKVRVSDTGIGIPEDKLPTIFDRFSRGTASYEGVYEGHGLGLHIVQKFVHLMKGEVSVETEVGKGSCFTLTFPFKELQEGKTKIPKERFQTVPRADTQAEAKPRILVVEDNPIGQMAVKLILNKLGYEVEFADAAEEVFAQLESGQYALIFMDVGIPGMSGDELTSAIRRSEKTAQSPRTPIIGLTAHADEETLQKCTDAGMDEVLLKPLTEETALMILEDYV